MALADDIEQTLRAVGTPERAEHEKRYLRSNLEFLGASVPAIRHAVRSLARAQGELTRDELLALVDALWQRDIHDCRMAAVALLRAYRDRIDSEDAARLERLLRESQTWALVDELAVAVVGDVVRRDGRMEAVLDRWSRSDDFWVRRTALLALLPGIRRDEPDLSRIDRYADAMLGEREFFIRKAVGWVLRELGRRRPAWVARWLAPRTARSSGVTIREAVKYLPAEDAVRLREAYTAGVPAV